MAQNTISKYCLSDDPLPGISTQQSSDPQVIPIDKENSSLLGND